MSHPKYNSIEKIIDCLFLAFVYPQRKTCAGQSRRKNILGS
ncbi:MAG: hypothetical protein ACTSPW_15295 [Promethearchaeota archaeon]